MSKDAVDGLVRIPRLAALARDDGVGLRSLGMTEWGLRSLGMTEWGLRSLGMTERKRGVGVSAS